VTAGEQLSDSDREITLVAECEVYRNRFVTVYDDDVSVGGTRPGRYLRIVESGGRPGVAVLAECRGTFALVRTYRYALGSWEWGIPRGYAHGDDPLASAAAELDEELGGPPYDVVPLGVVAPNSGMLTARVRLFYARYDQPVATPADVHEVAEVRWLDLASLLAEIADQRIIEGFTMAAVAAALARGLLPL
jgi:8-oxo-dGTP pyrophosphatase MutT (NUDIX family)